MKTITFTRTLIIALCGAALSVQADIVLDWNSAALSAIRARNTPPPMAARDLAILHIAICDAVNSIAKTHEPYTFAEHTSPSASRQAAVAAAGHHALTALYTNPADVEAFATLYESQLSHLPDTPRKRKGIQCGEAAAAAILELRSNDGSGNTEPFPGSTEPGRWRPTISFGGLVRPALLPLWGSVAPFALTSGSQLRPPAPPALSSERYTEEFEMVKAFGRNQGSLRTADQTEIALFWGYGPGTATPPGHWNQIAHAVATTRHNTMEQNARLFALLNIALTDAGISCWDCKYIYNFWRPITAIHEADLDGNPATVADPDWTPLLVTPPFPEYTSGHSTFSGAAAAVLAAFYRRDNVAFSIGSDDLPDVTRSYGSFSEAAWESGLSRIYGGIHFMSANLNGLATGATLGEWTVSNHLRPKRNRSHK